VVRAAAVETPVRSALGLREWEMGGGDECGEEGRAPCPFIGSEGEWGDGTGKGIRRPVVAASMSAIWFGGEGKRRGEWGVKRGAKYGAIFGRGWVIEAAGACRGGGGGGARSGFWRRKTASRLTGWAHLSVRGRWCGRLGQ
jgi:hypothetical protein